MADIVVLREILPEVVSDSQCIEGLVGHNGIVQCVSLKDVQTIWRFEVIRDTLSALVSHQYSQKQLQIVRQ